MCCLDVCVVECWFVVVDVWCVLVKVELYLCISFVVGVEIFVVIFVGFGGSGVLVYVVGLLLSWCFFNWESV